MVANHFSTSPIIFCFSPSVKSEASSPAPVAQPSPSNPASKKSLMHSSKQKSKDTSLSLSNKRPSASDDTNTPKSKKKKADKAERTPPEQPAKGVKEVAILSPTTELAKVKSLAKEQKGKVKDNKVKKTPPERKTPPEKKTPPAENAPVPSSIESKSTPRESKHHKHKEESRSSKKDKKERKLKEKGEVVSPDYPSYKDDPPKLAKLTVKRTSTDNWLPTNNHDTSQNSGHDSKVNNSVNYNNNHVEVTTPEEQNKRVHDLMAEYANEGSSSEDDAPIPNDEKPPRISDSRIPEPPPLPSRNDDSHSSGGSSHSVESPQRSKVKGRSSSTAKNLKSSSNVSNGKVNGIKKDQQSNKR